VLAFGGAGCDGESRQEIYERACEKYERCLPEFFDPTAEDYSWASVEECAYVQLAYTNELADDYTSTAACSDALLELYDCYFRAYADLAGCEYYDDVPPLCDDEYEYFTANCYDEGYHYHD
jgi:hypothetical protein